MAAKVTWLGRAADKIRRELIPSVAGELKTLFPHATAIGVHDCFSGYSQNHDAKLVLGVEVRTRDAYRTHVVKIGTRNAVASDYEGWRRCVLQHNFASRIFVSLSKCDLPQGRLAIIYEDAFRLFGSFDVSQGPQTLEGAAFSAISDAKPDPVSVERVIRQVYTELFRWFYRAPETPLDGALAFYKRRLRRAVGQWTHDPWRKDLRRDVIWLLCRHDPPTPVQPAVYLDPCDYVCWALKNRRIPQTLVGRSHGDLHGRNILVGVQRGEAEYPAVYDYGEMGEANVLVWDFVKLESELKVRILLDLYADEEARSALYGLEEARKRKLSVAEPTEKPSSQKDRRSLRAHQLGFAYLFESVLAELTHRIEELSDPGSADPPGGRLITGNGRLDRALALVLRVRQEAALLLGVHQPQRGRHGLWKDEYFFGLAVYGVSTAKFDYKESEAAFALVSAGVAIAQTGLARNEIAAAAQAPINRLFRPGCRITYPYPAYQIPLAQARRLWKSGLSPQNLGRATRLLEFTAPLFGHSVPLLQQYALVLAETDRHSDALKLLSPLEDLCRVFGDEETLSRIGRTCKDIGDRALDEMPAASGDLRAHPAWQWYDAAFKRYEEAFRLSGGYYSGINAATLAMLCGAESHARRLAEEVLEICGREDLSRLDPDSRFWVVATQGEASLLLRSAAKSAAFYREALSALPRDKAGMARSAQAQVRRLARVLGKTAQPVLRLFRT